MHHILHMLNSYYRVMLVHSFKKIASCTKHSIYIIDFLESKYLNNYYFMIIINNNIVHVNLVSVADLECIINFYYTAKCHESSVIILHAGRII